jgi:hypothetical protein
MSGQLHTPVILRQGKIFQCPLDKAQVGPSVSLDDMVKIDVSFSSSTIVQFISQSLYRLGCSSDPFNKEKIFAILTFFVIFFSLSTQMPGKYIA